LEVRDVGDETSALEEAKSEALAAFAAVAAVIDLSSGEPLTPEQTRASAALRAAAVRHLSAALEIMRREKGVNA
jgi:hypothetical protein